MEGEGEDPAGKQGSEREGEKAGTLEHQDRGVEAEAAKLFLEIPGEKVNPMLLDAQ